MVKVKQLHNKSVFSGDLTRYTITRDFDKKYRKIVQCKVVQLDLSEVNKIDTAGLAWLLLLIELAAKVACDITLINVPEKLLILAKLSSVSEFLPIAP